MNDQTFLLRLQNVSKHYGDFIANDAIDLSLKNGEIHALLGENGAGKSTLVKTLYGIHAPTSGEIFWRGKTIRITSPHHARSIGISMIFQYFSLFDALTVGENIALGLDHPTQRKDLNDSISTLSERYGLAINPQQVVLNLSTGERQRVEIIRALLQNPTLLIMDEPTSVLTPQEIKALSVSLKRFREDGKTILYISHKLKEVRELCDQATILRQGKVVARCVPQEETERSLAEKMIGDKLQEIRPQEGRKLSMEHSTVLTVHNLCYVQQDGIPLKNISFNLHAGEILGIAGVAGNGQDELAELIVGERAVEHNDSICFHGQPIGDADVVQRRALGMNSVPVERLGKGTVEEMTLPENMLLTGARAFSLINRWGIIDHRRAQTCARETIDEFYVSTPQVRAQAGNLSGGNLQKYILGREIKQSPKLLVIYNPTWGLDAGAIRFIRQSLLDLATQGTAILLISQDLDELFEISDRIAVLFAGELSSAYPRAALTYEQVGLLMGGVREI